ncbi:MAG: ABC transporter ATP-binding protein [Candidatus Rokubacteria bacterium]|nr:ABC transporter ATP-binding protein [Candidatus Rokubacteria bacterium]
MGLLDVDRVSKRFGGVRAVQEVSFTVDAGELLGIMGPNGSGKTTLFNLVAGALAPDAGTVRFQGDRISGLAPHRVCARGVARTFQLVRPFVGLTALENVLVGRLYGADHAALGAAVPDAARLLTLVGLDGKGHRRGNQLTLIDRKRLELARALATAPKLLLLDEFMAGLNPTETETAMALVRRLQGEGLTLLMVEHIVWALMDLSHRLIVLSAGEKIAEGTPAVIAADPTVVEVYLGTHGAPARA